MNAVFVNMDGSLSGTNFDGFGFLENLKLAAPERVANQGPVVASLIDVSVSEGCLVS